MKKVLALFLVCTQWWTALCYVAFAANDSSAAYTLTLRDNGNGSYTLTASAPAGASLGKIVVSASDRLTLTEGSLTSPVGGVTNESYSKNGVEGACVVFTLLSPLTEETVVFSATYTGTDVSTADLSVPEWSLDSAPEGDIVFTFVPYDPDTVVSSESSAEESDEVTVIGDPGYKVTLIENGNGTYTVQAAVSMGVNSGKIVISVSDSLSLIPGSLKSMGITNESYSRDGVVGACVSFSSAGTITKDTVVLTATYTAAEGAVIGLEDVSAPEWNLSLNGVRILTNLDGRVTYEYIPHTHALGDWIQTDEGHYKECACGYVNYEGTHYYEGVLDKDCNDCGYIRIIKGDVNFDGMIDNLDAAEILKYDAALVGFDETELIAGDKNNDGEVNNIDAVQVLWFDSGIVTE